MARTTGSRKAVIAGMSIVGITTLAPVLLPAANGVAATPMAANDGPAADAAADYIVGQLVDDHVADDAGGATADVVLSLVAVGGHDDQVQATTDWLAEQAATYAVDNGPAAGKFAVAAVAAGRDPRSFGGVDLVAELQSQINDEGQCGSFGFAFGQAWCVLGLERAGAPVPDAAVDYLVTFQDDSGAFGYDAGGFVADNDASGLALAALAGAVEQPGARESAIEVRDYLTGAQHKDGYWTNFSPVNTTGLVGPAMQLVGTDVSAATSWMVGQQLAGGGLPNVLDGTDPDLMATTQGAVLLSGESYLSVGPGGTDRVDLGTVTPSPTTSTTTTTSPTEPTTTTGTSTSTTTTTTGTGTSTSTPTTTGTATSTSTVPPTSTGPTGGSPLPTGPVVETDQPATPGSGTSGWLVSLGLLVAGGAALALARPGRKPTA